MASRRKVWGIKSGSGWGLRGFAAGAGAWTNVKTCFIAGWLTVSFVAVGLQPAPAAGPAANPYALATPPQPLNRIDELVFARLTELGIPPANPSTDPVFLRRAYLDVIGTLPTMEEAREFLLDRNPGKRGELIDRLLERNEFTDYRAMKWCEVLRVKAEFPINLWPNAVQAYHRWIRTGLRDNVPYDRLARELLTANGSNFRVPPVNFFRALQGQEPEALAAAVALTFMGERFDEWPDERRAGMAAFFANVGFKSTAEWKEEIVYFDPGATNANLLAGAREATFPDGAHVWLCADKDPREVFADWLIRSDNPWFARVVANRIWAWLLGRGIVHEPDDFRPDNPSSNPALLDFLAAELVRSHYDLKSLYRLILNSQTYQLASVPASDDPRGEANFAAYPLRRLEAEVLIDALCQVSGTTEKYESPIPEPFTFIPEGTRAIALADGSITSPFLELFGRPPRDTGLMSERNNEPTTAQRLHLLNSSHVQRKLEQSPRLRALVNFRGTPQQVVTRVYLTLLSRFPTQAELQAVQDYLRNGPRQRGAAATDVIWALINSAEFLYRH